MKLGLLSTTTLLAALALPALAQEQRGGSWMAANGLYGSAKGGWTDVQDQSFGSGKIDFNDGYSGSAAVGKKFGNMRAEVEALYSNADVDKVNGAGGGGNNQLMAGMVNGYYDFDNSSYWTPYVGAGVGYGRLRFNDYQTSSAGITNDDDDVMVYQGIAGMAYEFNPCWSFTGEYRYVGTTKADVQTAGGGTGSERFGSHNVLAGVRYTF